jgi:hypothetical protein
LHPGSAEAKVAPLLRALAPAVAARLASERAPSPHAVATLAWSYGAIGITADADDDNSLALWRALAAAAVPLAAAGAFTPQGLCNAAWGFARARHAPRRLFAALGAAAAALPPPLRPVDAASLAHAFAAAGAPHPGALAAVRASVAAHAPHFTPRQVATTAWALATMNEGDAATMGALCGRAARSVAALTPQGAANLAWALATARHEAPALAEALAAHAAPRLDAFSAQGLGLLSFSYASFAQDAPVQFMDALAAALDARLAEVSAAPQALALLCWGLAAAAPGGGVRRPSFARARAALAAVAGALPREGLAQAYQIELILAAEGAPGWDRRSDGVIGVRIGNSSSSSSSSAAVCADVAPGTPAAAVFAALFASGAARAAARAAWAAAQRGHSSTSDADDADAGGVGRAASATQARVFAAACALSASLGANVPMSEHVLRDGYSLDVAWPSKRIGLEVDGPSHFTSNTARPTGATRLKRRMLAAAGWRVAAVPFWSVDDAMAAARAAASKRGARSGAEADVEEAMQGVVAAAPGPALLAALAEPQQQQPALHARADAAACDASDDVGDAAASDSAPNARSAAAGSEEEADGVPGASVLAARAEVLALARARFGSSGSIGGGGAAGALRGVLALRVARGAASGSEQQPARA